MGLDPYAVGIELLPPPPPSKTQMKTKKKKKKKKKRGHFDDFDLTQARRKHEL